MDTFPRFTAAAVQAAPVFLDPAKTVQKAVGLIHEAAAAGASLIAFPEVFVPGYPYWNWTMNPVKGGEWFERYYRAAIDIPGPHLDTLRAAAAATKTTVVIGVKCACTVASTPANPAAVASRTSSSNGDGAVSVQMR